MCGICGYYSKQTISREALRIMNDTMLRRGPDDSGEELHDAGQGYTVGLAQRRLSILDLSPLGHQPMHSQDGRLSLVYNGEIYNFPRLKEELDGYPFRSGCDTEVILAAYLRWGIGCVDRFNGMFAFALFDREDDSLYLARDRIGKKPLYYWETQGDLVFASELKPILRCPGFSGEIRSELLERFLVNQYINAPDTIFRDVWKLPPGSICRFRHGRKEEWKYWEVAGRYHALKGTMRGSMEEAKEELKEKLGLAVRQRMLADVPLGAFLSGGYDSSLITALAQKESDTPLKTFSIGFTEEEYDEAKYAKAVAEYLGTDHTQRYISEKDLFSLIEGLAGDYDEPFADSSQLPSMLVSELAKESVTVALSGDGGDELFCGYNHYQMLAVMQKLDGVGALADGFCRLPGVRRLGLMERLPARLRIVAANRGDRGRVQPFGCLQGELAGRLVRGDTLSYRLEGEERYGEADWQIRRMLLDMDSYLPGDILCKVDRASMKYSLEARCPLLDKEIIEYSFTLPHEYKYRGGEKKRILKELACDYLPRELMERPKQGFCVPLDKWLRGPLRERLMACGEAGLLDRQGLFRGQETERFLKSYLAVGDKGRGTGENYSRFVWAFFVFQQWYEKWMGGLG